MEGKRVNDTFVLTLIVLFSLYQLSMASDCSFSGISFQSQTYRSKSLTSPNYPLSFPRATSCRWSLRRPSTSFSVRLTFHSFNLEVSSGCTHDFVEIRDGDKFSTSILIGKFCGTRLPPIIASRYTFIFVKFVSDSDYFPSRGSFSASFVAFRPVSATSKCSFSSPFLHNNNLQLSSSSGETFRSPSYPSSYPNNMVCTWKITAPSAKKLKLNFNYFRLESGVCSTNDFLEVRDGSSSTSIIKGKYCGTYAPTITSSGRYLWIRFRSDATLSYKGFEARYTVVNQSSSKAGIIVGVLVVVVVVITTIIVVIYCVKRKKRRIENSHAVPVATATNTVTRTQVQSTQYGQPVPQQYQFRGMQTRPPPSVNPGPPPFLGYGMPNAVYVAPTGTGFSAYPPPQGVAPVAQAPPAYYSS
ncbi:embryonic protein UVS.2-like isoform X1 [Montipora capricornis]|uniref:embryonic protein UVS.2-like isoform X1 n=1 Tax=Montipora capricornis TaxID=246305 RepID=UPI0035F1C271